MNDQNRQLLEMITALVVLCIEKDLFTHEEWSQSIMVAKSELDQGIAKQREERLQYLRQAAEEGDREAQAALKLNAVLGNFLGV